MIKPGQKIILHVRYDGESESVYYFRPYVGGFVQFGWAVKSYNLHVNKYIYEGQDYFILLSFDIMGNDPNSMEYVIWGTITNITEDKQSLIDEILNN